MSNRLANSQRSTSSSHLVASQLIGNSNNAVCVNNRIVAAISSVLTSPAESFQNHYKTKLSIKMSASPTARQAITQALPMITRKIVISDPIHMPEVYSSTPGGTLYSTTPGGTKLIYERAFMKNLRGSPLSQTPPSNVPSCLLRGTPRTPFRKCVPVPTELVKSTKSLKIEDQEQFQLDL